MELKLNSTKVSRVYAVYSRGKYQEEKLFRGAFGSLDEAKECIDDLIERGYYPASRWSFDLLDLDDACWALAVIPRKGCENNGDVVFLVEEKLMIG